MPRFTVTMEIEFYATDLAHAKAMVEERDLGSDTIGAVLFSARLFTGSPGLDEPVAAWNADEGRWEP